ncbi:MAG: hypothetical protein [Podoviridae sp. ctKoA10]|nr:MAG: hypothetical protein [Podoviridae sp. ctKoA10]
MVSCCRCRLVVHDLPDDGGGSEMIILALIVVLFVAMAVGAYMFAQIELEEYEEQIKQQQDDWEYFLRTGDDAGYKRRMKQ